MTTQERTTGGLPGTTGGALPADRDLPGTETRPGDPRPGDRLLADPLCDVVLGYLPSLSRLHAEGLVTRIRRSLA